MEFTTMDMLSYFLFYAFAGWVIEEIVYTLKEGKLVNRGFVNGPLCPLHGLSMVIIIWEFSEISDYPLFQYIGCIVLFAVAQCIAAVIGKIAAGHKLWNYESKYLNLDGRMGWIGVLFWGSVCAALLWFVQPFFYMTIHLIPNQIRFVILLVTYILFAMDFAVSTGAVLHIHRSNKLAKNAETVAGELKKSSDRAAGRFFAVIENRMYKAFPELQNQTAGEAFRERTGEAFRENTGESLKENAGEFFGENAVEGFGTPKNRIFAKGVCFDKLVWLFFISALLGDWIETVFVWSTKGIFMSRSSLIYGTFSIVWGFGGAIVTALLYPLAKKNDRYIFIGGFLLGGIYEYSCSYIGEKFLGTIFWDYSNMRFNLAGRVNLLFCFFWGVLAIVWVKALYPAVSKPIEKIPPVVGVITTWIIVVVMSLNMLVSGLAIARYVDRKQNTDQQQNFVTDFLDHQYTDELIERIYPNMTIV